MTDRDFLIWLHERLVNVHKENELYDYMHRLRYIILNSSKDLVSKPVSHTNSIKELKERLKC